MNDRFGFLTWIIIGLLAGGLAKAVAPGSAREPKGCLMTMTLGLLGSLLVGSVMRYGFGTSGNGVFFATVIGATLGALLLITFFSKRDLKKRVRDFVDPRTRLKLFCF